MSPRNWEARILDILECIENIQSFTSGQSYSTFRDDLKTVRAVAFELTTIGEAARAIPGDIIKRHPQVPWDKMQQIRNVIVHEYFRMDEEILWQTIQEDLPILAAQLKTIISQGSTPGK